MNEIIDIFNKLELNGWICFLKWDGERGRKKKTLCVSNPQSDQSFRFDFDDHQEATIKLLSWLESEDIEI